MSSVTATLMGRTCILRLSEPATLNALSPRLKADLFVSLTDALANPAVRALVLTGEGDAFCAGAELSSLHERESVESRERVIASQRLVRAIMSSDKPVVAAVNGAAAGAGFSLALSADLICVSTRAFFRPSFLAIGAVPDLGLAYLLPRAVGRYRAADIILSNQQIRAEESVGLGIARSASAPEALLDDALEVADRLASGPYAVGLTKRLLNRGAELPIEAYLEFEAAIQAVAFGTHDFNQGVQAIRTKQRPVFNGN